MKRTKIPAGKSWIYQIQSKVNDKIYVSSALNLRNRKHNHFKSLKDNNHFNIYLQNHSNKYGIEDLQFAILEFCLKEKLIEQEQYYIDTLKPEFNICKKAGSQLGMKRSNETRRKLVAVRTGMKRPKTSLETRRSMHSYWFNNKTKHDYHEKSLQSHGKIEGEMKGWRGRNRSTIDQYDLYGNFVASYSRLEYASYKTGVSEDVISKCMAGGTLSAGGFIWVKACWNLLFIEQIGASIFSGKFIPSPEQLEIANRKYEILVKRNNQYVEEIIYN